MRKSKNSKYEVGKEVEEILNSIPDELENHKEFVLSIQSVKVTAKKKFLYPCCDNIEEDYPQLHFHECDDINHAVVKKITLANRFAEAGQAIEKHIKEMGMGAMFDQDKLQEGMSLVKRVEQYRGMAQLIVAMPIAQVEV